MDIFTKVAGQMTNEMESALNGFLIKTSVKVILRMIIWMVSK
jgi:hypothetical protein